MSARHVCMTDTHSLGVLADRSIKSSLALIKAVSANGTTMHNLTHEGLALEQLNRIQEHTGKSKSGAISSDASSSSSFVDRDTIFPRIGRVYSGSSMPLYTWFVMTTVPGCTPRPPHVPTRIKGTSERREPAYFSSLATS